MNPSTTSTVSPLRQRMLDDMRLRKLDAKTQSTYIRAVRRLAMFLGRSPDTVIRNESWGASLASSMGIGTSL
jgi:integrase/recombinase XerD